MASRTDHHAPIGWLCPTEGHRARMLDMGERVQRARIIATAAAAVGLVATIGETGWMMLVLLAIGILNLATFERRMKAAKRPERVVAFSILVMVALLGVAAVMTGGGESPALTWLVIPVAVTAARFRAHVVWAAAGVAGLVALAVTGIGAAHKTVDPLFMVATLVLIVGVTAITTALMDAELQFRHASVLDALTGLLNRTGLESRFAEVAEQARLLDRPVCMVMCDLDDFKRINDEHGHDCGDLVLCEVSGEMRKSLRSFELFYRLGGEEFLVLLPGIDLTRGLEIAESLRVAVEGARPAGVAVTASLGVSVASGEGIDFQVLYKAADDALYAAKDAGRNLVVAARIQAEPALLELV